VLLATASGAEAVVQSGRGGLRFICGSHPLVELTGLVRFCFAVSLNIACKVVAAQQT